MLNRNKSNRNKSICCRKTFDFCDPCVIKIRCESNDFDPCEKISRHKTKRNICCESESDSCEKISRHKTKRNICCESESDSCSDFDRNEIFDCKKFNFCSDSSESDSCSDFDPCKEKRRSPCREKRRSPCREKIRDPCRVKCRPHCKPCDIDRHKRIVKLVRKENLVSDIPGLALRTDPNLVNSWGLININGVLTVADNGTSLVTTYDPNGNILPTVVTVNDNTGAGTDPTGIVQNKTNDFAITNGGLRAPALWLVASEGGFINGYFPLFDSANSTVVVDRSVAGAVYKGITIASNNGRNFIYATDFHNNKVDVFDANFNQIFTFPFADATLPPGFAPFNIQLINNLLYVTYALQKPPDNHDDQAGPGNGFINIFSTSGILIRRFASRGPLNSPWGITQLSHDLIIVGNFGDGTISIFDNNGIFLGKLKDCNNTNIFIDGLWGLLPIRLLGSHNSTIYFASGPNGEANGLLGRLVANCKNPKICKKHVI
jgi:uncharacterized protein (TIGR03118 family)